MTFFPPEILARIVYWLYQSGDKLTATRLLISHKNPELVGYCKQLEQPIVFTMRTDYIYSMCLVAELDVRNVGQHVVGSYHGDVMIDWGDGKWDVYKWGCEENHISHQYDSKVFKTYRVRIYAKKLKAVKRLHSLGSFHTIGNVITSCEHMFYGSGINIPLIWDTSLITNMYGMFRYAYNFNSIIPFNTSNCTNLAVMFDGASNFNQPVQFNTSNCKNMDCMFRSANAFNQPVNFDTSNVTSMLCMFADATSFNQVVSFDTSKVNQMQMMFRGAKSLEHLPVLNTSSCTHYGTNELFAGTKKFPFGNTINY